MTTAFEDILQAGWKLPRAVWDNLSEYERSFAHIELSDRRTRGYYRSRLRQIGFINLDCVLDAGCGIGQWSIALGDLNAHVLAVDLNPTRVNLARGLASGENQTNITFGIAPIERLPFRTNTFDAVFCYGVFMFSNIPVTLAEFYRVLKPGGLLYVNANSLGWYLHLIVDRGMLCGNWRLVRTAVLMIGRRLFGRTKLVVVSERWLRKLLDQAGYTLLDTGAEGEVVLPGSRTIAVASAYSRSFYGFRAIVEELARKRVQ